MDGQKSIDKLDVGIARELNRGNVRNLMLLSSSDLRQSFRSIGRRLHVDQGTVRNRIKKLKEIGVIRGWRLEVNPAVFGRKVECLMFDVPPDWDKREVIRKMSKHNAKSEVSSRARLLDTGCLHATRRGRIDKESAR